MSVLKRLIWPTVKASTAHDDEESDDKDDDEDDGDGDDDDDDDVDDALLFKSESDIQLAKDRPINPGGIIRPILGLCFSIFLDPSFPILLSVLPPSFHFMRGT